MKRISMSAVLLSTVVAISMPACGVEQETGEDETSSVDQAATGYQIGTPPLWYYKTDDFDEQCGSAGVSVLTNTGWNSLDRGVSEYLKPATASNGTFQWKCGNSIEFSECDDAPAQRVRFYWDPYSRRIDVTCYKRCGDGTSYSDCAPY